MEIGLSTLAAPVRWARALHSVIKDGGAYMRLGAYQANTRALVCDLQGKLALMVVNTSERHKQLRLLCDEYKAAKSECKATEQILAAQNQVQEAIKAVDSFSQHTLFSATESVFRALDEHFKTRTQENTHKPRFCVKVRKSEKIVTLSRSNGERSKDYETEKQTTLIDNSFETLINKNTGFNSVSTSGRTFFCNDICSAAASGNYVNPRLDSRAVNRYKRPTKWERLKANISKQPTHDERWIDCWKIGINGRPSAAECYKSTVIVPINLKHSQIDTEFIDIFQLKHIDVPNEDSKYQFGYFCADSHEVDFFEQEDEHFMYACADLLSLFMIVARNFREASGTYAQARGIVAETITDPSRPRSRRSSSSKKG